MKNNCLLMTLMLPHRNTPYSRFYQNEASDAKPPSHGVKCKQGSLDYHRRTTMSQQLIQHSGATYLLA